jgi:predicted GIY-YIG superfamily endonuclease
MPDKNWNVYILRCADGTLYTGIAKNMERRLAMHQAGTGAKYTKGRGPLELVYRELHLTMSLALKREAEIKAMNREAKLKLVKDGFGT